MLNAQEQRQRLIGFLLILLSAVGFSAKAILIKLAYAECANLDAITLMAFRMLFSLPFFLVIGLWHAKTETTQALVKKDWALVALLGLSGYYLPSFLDFSGLKYISAGLERIILFLYPTFVVVFSAVLYKRKIKPRVGFALGLSYLGTLLVFVEHLTAASHDVILGSSLVLGSAVVFAGFLMGSGVMVHCIGSSRFTAYSMTVACLASLLHFAVQHGLALPAMPPVIYWLALVMAVFSTVMPSFLMNAGIQKVGAGTASIVSSTGPIVTLTLAHVFLNEDITPVQIGGTLLVLAGVYVVGKDKT